MIFEKSWIANSENISALPKKVQPPPSSRKYCTRRGIAEWLVEQLQEDHSTIVGIDHDFSFPLRFISRFTICCLTGRPFSMIFQPLYDLLAMMNAKIIQNQKDLATGISIPNHRRINNFTASRVHNAKGSFIWSGVLSINALRSSNS